MIRNLPFVTIFALLTAACAEPSPPGEVQPAWNVDQPCPLDEEHDGCIPTETPPEQVCPDALLIEPGAPELIEDSLVWADDHTEAIADLPGQFCPPRTSGGRERVLAVTPLVSGRLEATFGVARGGFSEACSDRGLGSDTCWDARLSVVGPDPCTTDGAEQIACADETTWGAETVSFAVDEGHVYHVLVDEDANAAREEGRFYVRFDLTE